MSLFKKLFGSKESNEQKPEPKKDNVQETPAEVAWMTDLRRNNLAISAAAGFAPVRSLPTELGRSLRPSLEIANRLHAIKALVLWLMVPPENLSDERILDFIQRNGLTDAMTEEETSILNVARDDEQARNAIGWKFENAWPLAWYFGYKEPDLSGQMMTGEQMQEILSDFTCPLDENIADWIKNQETVSEEKLMQKEDLFYCLHNAVRSAQMGSDTVPNGFDPMGNGGVIHERRHSLTFMVSNGDSWENTDLST
ncbi:DUF4272 domain-containing protein [Maribacter stanieri]|uniref:DUF4272 domain-containing protein n=1 Tax=Maribacter stanieri TaxID=440514 RepID=UPI0024957584|nr:DUF4272 domain-containing protein [Maribacter stanieri]|tara:strand:+ start:291 stop:1052 length:762 start_codon:yes stop_codon:yes gene_type:complete